MPAKSDYAASNGTAENGMFQRLTDGLSPDPPHLSAARKVLVSVKDVRDGLSNTFAIGEAHDVQGGRSPTNPMERARLTEVYWVGALWHDEDVHRKTDNLLNVGGDDDSFGSVHDGGAFFLFGDGSVKFISENIHSVPDVGRDVSLYGIYQRLGTMDDGLPVSDF